ncbi:bifunctional diguanylate cyclase/phosphodiesterase [Sphingosinithalassobacter tenebrarum]|uniref:Bifunctional diguanylate cyclase/phosphodiesterase n=1 Tax=Stakelama tenebrarum TaxID=2711215 RepID=A0A6G6Y439_9SPHN|nr:bifunctional diguanylate cyclase/phosphodiesterase [Sphingosinithalassobacter tenebrarum]
MPTHYGWHLVDALFATMMATALIYLLLLVRRTRRLKQELELRARAEESVARLIRFDSISGLPNRGSMLDAIAKTIAQAGPDERTSVLWIDLDRFRPINDLHGHACGDHALKTIGSRLEQLCENRAFAARISGDEFACVLTHRSDTNTIEQLAHDLLREISRPIQFRNGVVQLTASIGIAGTPSCPADGERLLRAAAFAGERSMRSGPGKFAFFEPEMDAAMNDRAALEIDMRAGIQRGEFIPYFQPIVSLRSGKLHGFECLARWRHPTRGFVSPDVFIPIAEDVGLIQDLSYAILSAACREAREWPAELTLSVNISPLQLTDSWLPERILRTLCETGFPAQRLIVEITESRLVGDFEAARAILTSLRNAGVQIALDDFGTGYSGLKHLRELQFNRVKIDRSFVENIETQENRAIIASILRLSEGLKLTVTAEGVEDARQAAALEALGCPLAQGYLFGRPGDARSALEHARAALARHAPRLPQAHRASADPIPATRIPAPRLFAAKG